MLTRPSDPHMQRREKFLSTLQGEGLEIGALDNPVIAPHLKIHYVDRLTREQALEHYPELKDSPLVDVDIIDDAEALASIPDQSQDFVIANHVIEHMVNPVKALLNWGRVLKPGGKLFLAVPDKHHTFDRAREKTSIEHLFLDYHSPHAERDFEHFREFSKHVTCGFFHAYPDSEFEKVAMDLWEKRYSIHYHVWDYDSFLAFLKRLRAEFPAWQMRFLKNGPTLGNECAFVLERSNGSPFRRWLKFKTA